MHDNAEGLRILYDEKCEKRTFTFESARNFFNCISDVKGENLVPDLLQCFVHCQMTNLDEFNNSKRYYSLAYVELLEMLCRVAHSYWTIRQDEQRPREDPEQ